MHMRRLALIALATGATLAAFAGGAPGPRAVQDSTPQEPAPAELRARFLFADGTPAPGVAVRLHGWASSAERVREFGVPDEWDDLQATSDAEGRVALRFDPPRAFQFDCGAQLAGHPQLWWRWSELPQHALTDLGDVTLERAGAVRCRILDAQGKQLTSGWSLTARSLARARHPAALQASVSAELDPATGTCLLEGLPPGPANVVAMSPVAGGISGANVEVRSGETVEHTLTYDGPDPSRCIVVQTVGPRFFPMANAADGSVVVTGAGGEHVALAADAGRREWRASDLEPGAYTLEVRDPRFEPWRKEGLEPGQRLAVQLVGSSAVRLALLGPDGYALGDHRLRVRPQGWLGAPRDFELHRLGERSPPDGLYAGLLAPGFTLIAEVPGLGACELAVTDLQPGETRDVELRFERPASLAGRLIGPRGANLAERSVVLVPAEAGVQSALEFEVNYSPSAPNRVEEARTDADGRFRFEALQPGRYLLVARMHGYLNTSSDVLELVAGAARNLELALPPLGALSARLAVPGGIDLERMWVTLCTQADALDNAYGPRTSGGAPRTRIAADGTLRLELLPPGVYQLWLVTSQAPLAPEKRTWSGAYRAAGVVQISAGPEVQASFDLAPQPVGSIAARVTIDGAPAGRARVSAVGRDLLSVREIRTPQVLVDAEGRAELQNLAAGEWRLQVSPPDGTWTWTGAESVRLPPGGNVETSLAIAVVAGFVRLVDAATGEPLREHVVDCVADNVRLQRRSDADGRIELRMPAGRLTLRDIGDGQGLVTPGPEAELAWTASGPVPAELRLTPAQPAGQR